MSKFKRYERYKDSGVEWIGEIPEHWEIKKIKYISNITMGQSPKSEECSLDETGLPFLQGNAEFTSLHPIPKIYCNTANKFSKVNDILLSVRAPVGAMNISDRVYGIGRGLCAITANKVQVRYLWYSMNVSLEELFIKSKGSTFEAVTVTDVNNLLSILPPKNEQIAIANFLDQKTAEIDGLIADKEKLIELLQEKRQAIITEAVTKGLNPNVRMKDSRIEWIGEIPEHWDLIKIKFISFMYSGNGFNEEYQGKTEGDYPFYKVSDINGDGKFVTIANNYVDKSEVEKNRWNIIPENSVLFPKIGEALKKNHRKINVSKCLIDNNTAALKPYKELMDINYFYYLLCCVNGEWFVNPGAVPSIDNSKLKNFKILLPPKKEQTAIANFLDQKTAEIDTLISDIQTQIDKLREYRQSIISEAATGKIKVL